MLNKESLVDLIHEDDYSRYEKILIILAVDANTPKRVTIINSVGSSAGLKDIYKWNVGQYLHKNKNKGLAVPLKEGWKLTSKGKRYVADKLNIELKSKRVTKISTSLRNLIKDIENTDTNAFLGEAISCFECDNFRATVVLSWVGAMSLLQDHVEKHHLAAFNTEATRRNSKWKTAKTAEDLTRMKEKDFLDIITSLSIIGKGVKHQLENCLKLRNSCGHPSSLSIGENTVASHIEILIKNVFQRF